MAQVSDVDKRIISLRRELSYLSNRKTKLKTTLQKIERTLSDDIEEANEKITKSAELLSLGVKIGDGHHDFKEDILNKKQKDVYEDYYLSEIIFYLKKEISYCTARTNQITDTIVKLEAKL